MEKKSKLKKLLATASAFAVIAGASNSALGADGDGYSRPVGNNARFDNINADFYNDQPAAGAAVFTVGNNFINARADADVSGVAALSTGGVLKNINSFNVYGHDATLTIGVTGGSLGSVYNYNVATDAQLLANLTGIENALHVNLAPGLVGAPRLNLTFGAGGHTQILTGTGGLVQGFNIPVGSYDNLGVIDFGGAASVLSVIVNDKEAIITLAKNATVVGGANAALATLRAKTNLIVKDVSFTEILNFRVANSRYLAFDIGNENINTIANSTYRFGDLDTTIKFIVDGSGNKTINLGALIDQGATDNKGRLEFSATTGGSLAVTGNAGTKNIGRDNANRLREVKISGTHNVTFNDVNVFAKSIIINNTATTEFVKIINSNAANNTLTFAAVGEVKFSGVGNNTISVGNFNGHAGTITLANGVNYVGDIDNDQTIPLAVATAVATAFDANNAITAVNAALVAFGDPRAAIAAAAFIAANPAGTVQQVIEAAIAAVNGDNNLVAAALTQNAVFGTNGNEGANAVVDLNVDNGTLQTLGAAVVDGAIGATKALNLINVGGPGAVNLGNANAVKATTLRVGGDATTNVTLGNAAALTGNIEFTANGIVTISDNDGVITGNISTTGSNIGSVVFSGAVPAGAAITGTIGAAGNAIASVQISNAGAVALSANAHHAQLFRLDNVGSILSVADNGSLFGVATGNAAAGGVISFRGVGAFTGILGNAAPTALTAVIANGNGAVTIGAGNHFVTELKAANAGVNNGFVFADGANLTGAITNTSGAINTTSLDFQGDSTVTGIVGGGAHKFNLITIGDGTVGLQAAVSADTLRIAHADAALTTGGLLTADVEFTAAGLLTANAGLTGGVALDNGGRVVVAGAGLTGNIISDANGAGSVNSSEAIAGIVNLTNGGSVITSTANGTINGAMTLGGNAVITASALATGNVAFAVDGGTLTARAGLAGNVALDRVGVVVVEGVRLAGNITSANNGAGSVSSTHGILGAIDLTEGGTVTTTTVDGTIDANGGDFILGNGAEVNASALVSNAANNGVIFANGGGRLTAGAGITDNVVLQNGGRVNVTGTITGDLTSGAGGGEATVENVVGNVAVGADVIVNQTGTVSGTLNVTGGQYLGTEVTNVISGLVTINTPGGAVHTLTDTKNGVLLTAGSLEMNDAINAGDVTVTAGDLTIRDVVVGNLLVNGGEAEVRTVTVGNVAVAAGTVNQTGAVGGTVTVANGGLYLGDTNANIIAGAVTINTANAGTNTLYNAANAVTLAAGNLTMNDATGAFNVTVNGGAFIAQDILLGNLLANGGTSNVTNVTAGNVTMTNGAVVSIRNNVGGTLTGAGVVTLTEAGTVTGAVGAPAASVTSITAQASRTFSNAGFSVTTLNLDSAGDLTISLAAASLGGTNITSNVDAEHKHIVAVSANQVITGTLGAADRSNLIIKGMGNGRTITVQTTKFHAGIEAENPNQVSVIFNLADASVLSLGTETVPLLDTEFTTTGRVIGNTFSKNINVPDTIAAQFGGRVKGEDLTLAGASSSAKFEDGAVIDTLISGTVNGRGLVTFEGSVTVNQDIGTDTNGIATVTFAAASADEDNKFIATLNAENVYAADASMSGSTVKPTKDIVFHGNVTTDTTPFELVERKITANKALRFAGNNSIAVKIVNNNEKLEGGQIIVAENTGSLSYAADTKFHIVVADAATGRLTGGKTSKYNLILNNGTAPAAAAVLNLANVTFTQTGKFTVWEQLIGTEDDENEGGLILVQTDKAKDKLKETLGTLATATDTANIGLFTNAKSGTQEYGLVAVLEKLVDANGDFDKGLIKEAIDRVTKPIETAADAIADASGAAGAGMGTRLHNVAGSPKPVAVADASNSNVIGLAAGDDSYKFGAWVSPFFSNTVQKDRKGAAGYKGSAAGASFGFDTRANDSLIIGAAITTAGSDMKHKSFKSGDKTKIQSVMLSIYSMQQITDAWYSSGVVTVGSNEVKNYETRISGAANGVASTETASGKYTSMSMSAEAMFGYNHVTEQVTITPMGGLRYTRVNGGSYKETGTTTQNLDISTKASNKFELVLGARVDGGTLNMDGMLITPEVHAFVNQDLVGAKTSQQASLGNGNFAKSDTTPVRTKFNVGVGANAEYSMMEYGAGYDLTVGDKSIGHQGTLRVRVNF